MLKSYVIMPALCSIHKTMHNARYNARLTCAGLVTGLGQHDENLVVQRLVEQWTRTGAH